MRVPVTISLLAATILAATSGTGLAERRDWVRFVEPEFHARMVYPSALFQQLPRAPGDIQQRFQSVDGKALLGFGAWRNVEGRAPAMLKGKILQDARYKRLSYQPRGRSWFVLSGYHEDNIYYHKVMYSCGGAVIAALALTYPTAQRAIYDPIVERMEDEFRPGRRCERN